MGNHALTHAWSSWHHVVGGREPFFSGRWWKREGGRPAEAVHTCMAADDGAADSPLSPFSSFPPPPKKKKKKKKAGLRTTYLEGGNNKLQQAQVRSESSPRALASFVRGGEASLVRPGKKGEKGKEEWRM